MLWHSSHLFLQSNINLLQTMETKTLIDDSKKDYWIATYSDGSVQSYKYDEIFIDDLINPELVGLIIPEGIVTIEYFKFGKCPKLESIHIPASLLKIVSIIYSDRSNLHSITVDQNNPQYCAYENALYTKDKRELIRFHNNCDISHFVIPSEVSEIGSEAFKLCQYLQTVEIPLGVKSIGEWAFQCCKNLKEIILPNSIDSFNLRSISWCNSLERIYLPKSIKKFGSTDIIDCEELDNFCVDISNPYFCSVDGVIFNKEKTILIRYPPGKKEVSYTVPESVLIIGAYAFGYCKNLINVELPKGLKYICSDVFRHCSKLERVNIPKSVYYIGNSIFRNCSNLKDIMIPHSVKRIEYFSDEGCRTLKLIKNYKNGKCYRYKGISIEY